MKNIIYYKYTQAGPLFPGVMGRINYTCQVLLELFMETICLTIERVNKPFGDF